MNRLLTLAALLTVAVGGWAMTEEEQDLMVWGHLDDILVEEAGHTAYMYYAKTDVDGDGIDDLIISTESRPTPGRAFKAYSVGKNMRPIEVSSLLDDELASRWTLMEYIKDGWSLPADDITLREPPIFISSMEKAKNEFMGWRDLGNYPPGSKYTHMVFKPHVNEIRFVKDDRIYSSLDGDTLWQDVREFKLKDPKVVAKMFRGYSDGVAVPVAVTQGFLATHQPLQFSRWLSPEPVRTVDRSAMQIVLAHYGMKYGIMRSQWLATLPTSVGNRDYYQVLLVGPKSALFATVCIAEGTVASAYEYEDYSETGYNRDLSNLNMFESDVDGLFSEHLPEIMCIMQTDKGLELYFRWTSMEGTHYSVVREVGTRMLLVLDEYHYWMFG